MRLVWLSGGLAAVLFAATALWLAPLHPNALALQFAFTPRSFGAIVHSWTPDQLRRYRAHFPADFALLACYAAFGWLLATRTLLFAARSRVFRSWAAWALPTAALCDAIENVFHLWLTEMPRFDIAWAYFASATAASLKWTLLLAWAMSVVVAWAGRRD